MNISLHSDSNGTLESKIDTRCPHVAVFPEKGDIVVVWLGINRVEIKWDSGRKSWVIRHNTNVETEVVPIRQEKQDQEY